RIFLTVACQLVTTHQRHLRLSPRREPGVTANVWRDYTAAEHSCMRCRASSASGSPRSHPTVSHVSTYRQRVLGGGNVARLRRKKGDQLSKSPANNDLRGRRCVDIRGAAYNIAARGLVWLHHYWPALEVSAGRRCSRDDRRRPLSTRRPPAA